MLLYVVLACALPLTCVNGCPDCESQDISDNAVQFLKSLDIDVEKRLELHRSQIQTLFTSTYQTIQNSLDSSDVSIQKAGDIIKSAIQRVVDEAPDKVSCLHNTKEAITEAMTSTGANMQDCTKDLTEESPYILKGLEQEERKFKEKIDKIRSSLLNCRRTAAQYYINFYPTKTCCAFDLWDEIRLVLEETDQPTDIFFAMSYRKAKSFKETAEGCLLDVGEDIIKKVSQISRDIKECAGIKINEEIE